MHRKATSINASSITSQNFFTRTKSSKLLFLHKRSGLGRSIHTYMRVCRAASPVHTSSSSPSSCFPIAEFERRCAHQESFVCMHRKTTFINASSITSQNFFTGTKSSKLLFLHKKKWIGKKYSYLHESM
jgi:hypothetical protein